MINSKFKLEPAFFAELHRRLESQRKSENESHSRALRQSHSRLLVGMASRELYGQETLPSISHLQELIETCFWTSLEREEGRTLEFTIKYVPEAWNEFSLSFEEPIEFNLTNLRKLGPALRKGHTCVAPSNGLGQLEICELTTANGEPFAIKVLDPGQLIVSFSSWNLAVISGGEPVFIRDRLLSWNNEIWSPFVKSDSTDQFSPFHDIRVKAVINVAREMRRARHGGAILVVPPDQDISASVDHLGYRVNAESQLVGDCVRLLRQTEAEPVENRLKIGDQDPIKFWEDQIVSDAPSFLSQLTLVDGATILSPDLQVIGFGARLKQGSDEQFTHVVCIDPLEHDNWTERIEVDKLGWGTRHKSAARFVFDNHQTIAIIASQDGQVTAFVWREVSEIPSYSGVHAFQRLELTLF